MSTQVFVASTAFGLATVVAALDDGAFGPAARRVLLLSNNATVPETATRVDEVAGVDRLLSRFDAVHDYNEAVAPQHPSSWSPRAEDLPILERHLSTLWSLGPDVHLVLESVWVDPALALCRIFPDARIDVYADGLMSYGPTRNKLPPLVATRIERLLHLDLVPGLSPVLLTEHEVRPRVIAAEAFRKTVAALGPAPDVVRSAPPGKVAVLLGQYLSALAILTPAEETDLHLDMVRGAVAAGYTRLVFKPHPSAPTLLGRPLVAEAGRLGATLTVHDSPELVETWLRAESVGCVVGCFSTALSTAASLYGLPVARVGTELLLERLSPYQNSNRIPVTLIDATVPPVSGLPRGATGPEAAGGPDGPGLAALVQAVSYCMQPGRYPALRPVAEQVLSEHGEWVRRYFRRRRLTRLDLPGGLPPAEQRRGVPAVVRAAVRRGLGPDRSRRLRRVSRRLVRARD